MQMMQVKQVFCMGFWRASRKENGLLREGLEKYLPYLENFSSFNPLRQSVFVVLILLW